MSIVRRLARPKIGVQRFDDAMDSWASAIESAIGLTAVSPIVIRPTPNGPVLALAGPQTMFAKLTANVGSGVYTFAEAYPTASGGFSVLSGGRTGECVEFNGNDTIPLSSPIKYVELRWFGEVDEWRFQAGTCS